MVLFSRPAPSVGGQLFPFDGSVDRGRFAVSAATAPLPIFWTERFSGTRICSALGDGRLDLVEHESAPIERRSPARTGASIPSQPKHQPTALSWSISRCFYLDEVA